MPDYSTATAIANITEELREEKWSEFQKDVKQLLTTLALKQQEVTRLKEKLKTMKFEDFFVEL